MSKKHELGRQGEEHAARFLGDKGYSIVDRNWRCQSGEIDIVATHGAWIVFVEVKTRSTGAFGHPFEAVTAQKIQRIRRVMSAWFMQKHTGPQRARIDVVAVHMPPGGVPTVEHLVGVGA